MENLFNSCPENYVWDPITESCVAKDSLRTVYTPPAKYTGKYPKLFYKGQEFRKKANQYLRDFDTGKRIKPTTRNEEKSLLWNLKRDKRIHKKDFKNLKKIDKIGSFLLDKIDEKKYGKYTDSSGKEKTLNPYSILSTRQGYYALKDARKKGTLSSRAWRSYVSDYGKYFNPNFKKFTKKQMRDWKKNYISDATNFTNQVAKLIHYGVLPAASLGAGFSSIFNAPTTATLSGTLRNSAPGLRDIIFKNIATRGKDFWNATKTGWNTGIPGTKGLLTPNTLTTGLFGAVGAKELGDPESESRKNLQEAINNPTAENIAKATATTGIDILNIGMAGGNKAFSHILRPLDKYLQSGVHKFDDLGYKAIEKLNPAFSQMLRNKNITPTKLGLTGGLGAAIASSDEDTQNAIMAGLPVIVSGGKFNLNKFKKSKYPISDKFAKNIFGAIGMYPSSKVPEITKQMVNYIKPQHGGLLYGGGKGFLDFQKIIGRQHLAHFLNKYSGASEKQLIKDVADIYQGPGIGREAIKKQLQQMSFLDAMRSRPEVFQRMLLDQHYSKQNTFLDLADLYNRPGGWQNFEKELGKELAESFAGLGQQFKGQTRFDLIKEFIQQNKLNKGLPLNQKEATAVYGYQGLIDSELNSLLRGSPLTALTKTGKRIPVEGSTAEAIRNFLPKIGRDLESSMGKQKLLEESRSFLRGERSNYPVKVKTPQGREMSKNLSDVDPGDVILRQDFTSGQLLPKNFRDSPVNLYEGPYQSSFGPIVSEYIAPKGTQGLFFPSQRFGNIFTNENEFLWNPNKYKYMVVNNFYKNMHQLAKTNVAKAVEQEKLLHDKVLPHYQFQIMPRAKGGRLKPKNIPMYYDFEGTPIHGNNTSLPFRYGGRIKNYYQDGGLLSRLFRKKNQGIPTSNINIFNSSIPYLDKINYVPSTTSFTPGFEEGPELEAYDKAYDEMLAARGKTKTTKKELEAEKERIKKGKETALKLADIATYGDQYSNVFKTKLGPITKKDPLGGTYQVAPTYCMTRACELERQADYTTVKDMYLYNKFVPKGSPLDVIPGIASWVAHAEEMGYEKVDPENREPGDIALFTSPGKTSPSQAYHAVKYAGPPSEKALYYNKNKALKYPEAGSFYSDPGSGEEYILYNKYFSPKDVTHYYRYVGKTPQLQSAYDKAIADYKLEKEELGQTTVPRMKPMTVDRLIPTVNQMGRTYNLDTESPQLIEDQRKYVQNLGNMLNRQRMYRHGGHMYDLFTHGTYGKGGQLIKRADGSYSQRGLWDNIRKKAKENKAAGKEGKKPKPGSPMDKQIKKIRRNS